MNIFMVLCRNMPKLIIQCTQETNKIKKKERKKLNHNQTKSEYFFNLCSIICIIILKCCHFGHYDDKKKCHVWNAFYTMENSIGICNTQMWFFVHFLFEQSMELLKFTKYISSISYCINSGKYDWAIGVGRVCCSQNCHWTDSSRTFMCTIRLAIEMNVDKINDNR